jgi:hypothetical protein
MNELSVGMKVTLPGIVAAHLIAEVAQSDSPLQWSRIRQN